MLCFYIFVVFDQFLPLLKPFLDQMWFKSKKLTNTDGQTDGQGWIYRSHWFANADQWNNIIEQM